MRARCRNEVVGADGISAVCPPLDCPGMADVGTRGGGAAIEISRSTASGAAVSLGSSDEIAVLREAFRRDYCVLLPGFFDAGFTDEISHAIQQAAFYHRQHGKIGSEGCMEAN